MPKRMRRIAAIALPFVVGGLIVLFAAWHSGSPAERGVETGATTVAPAGHTAQDGGAGRPSTSVRPDRPPSTTVAVTVTTRRGDRLVALTALPRQAQETWRLVQAGGPFPSSRDGVIFNNRERLLPSRPAGYYHEYTVPTPGEDDRGARRLVTGRDGELYYSDDHYASFVVVDPGR